MTNKNKGIGITTDNNPRGSSLMNQASIKTRLWTEGINPWH